MSYNRGLKLIVGLCDILFIFLRFVGFLDFSIVKVIFLFCYDMCF